MVQRLEERNKSNIIVSLILKVVTITCQADCDVLKIFTVNTKSTTKKPKVINNKPNKGDEMEL